MMRFYSIGGNLALSRAETLLIDVGWVRAEAPGETVSCLLLPVPSFPSSIPDLPSILASLPKTAIIFGGGLSDPILAGYHTVDLLKDPYYLAWNAAITARCAIHLAGEDWIDSPVLILGWGRIGKCLGKFLTERGARVTVAARKEKHLGMLGALGYGVVPIAEVSRHTKEFSVIYNTIPAMILPEPILQPGCSVYDLSSVPGIGGTQVISARGLPGKYAPEESGRLIAETLLRLSARKEL